MNPRPIIIVLHGPSGVGKDTVIDRLRERTGIHRATSCTSRPPRDDEVDGIHYHFLSEAQFEEKLRRGDFAEHAVVYEDYKGLERSEIEGPLGRGEDVIIRTDVQGARTWRTKLDGAIYIFLMAEDREVLRLRLEERGSEDGKSLALRIAELEAELDDIENNDYVVLNHDGKLEDTVSEIEDIIEAERANLGRNGAKLIASRD